MKSWRGCELRQPNSTASGITPFVRKHNCSTYCCALPYQIGEPIVATVLIRNSNDLQLTNQMMEYMRFDSAYDDGPTVFKVCDSSGKFLSSFADQAALKALALTHGAWVPTGKNALLYPGTQDKYAQRVDAQFSFVSGDYHVFAIFKILAWKISSPDGKKIRNEPLQKSPKLTTSPGEKREPEMLEVESAPVPLKIYK